jgi:phosphoglycolate phosphatase-like HAD superfamily hydrolase
MIVAAPAAGPLSAHRVVLFDIDGTLLRTDGVGRRAMEAAFADVLGVSGGDPTYTYDGRTDRQIVRWQLRHAGFDDAAIEAVFDVLFARYLEHLTHELTTRPGLARACAGVPDLLAHLAHEPTVTLGLLTGNIRDGAARKLAAIGVAIDDFAVGAFGCDHEDRPALPSIAQARASARLGFDVPGAQLVIIGDTPADIACGRSIGVRAIGVATGRYSVDELASHDPYATFATLEDTARVVEAIVA